MNAAVNDSLCKVLGGQGGQDAAAFQEPYRGEFVERDKMEDYAYTLLN